MSTVETLREEARDVPEVLSTERMNIVVTGHVDHGKSTIVGRLLADTGSLPIGKLDAVRRSCERNSRPFEYAFLLDALKDEQAQGITIDAARVFFKTDRRHYIIIDAPGHTEFMRNMVTGAARAQAAVLVIDAKEGIQDNSRRHGYLLSMLGIGKIVVLVNKMDLVGYSHQLFESIVADYRDFLRRVDIEPTGYIPVSGWHGDNLAERSKAMDWYGGPTLLEALDAFQSEPAPVDQPFRMPVQAVYKFTQHNDDRRIVAGTVETGRLRIGDEVVFYPSCKKARARSIEAFSRPLISEATASQATGFTLEEQIYVVRGELAVRADEKAPLVATRVRVNLFWLGKSPLRVGRAYVLKLGTARVSAQVEQIHRVIDAAQLISSEDRQSVDRHEVADCTLAFTKPLAFDLPEHSAATSRFVLVDQYEICGGGIIGEALADSQTEARDRVLNRNLKWLSGGVPEERRAERLGQRASLLLITGGREVDRKKLGRDLETRLFDEGRFVYFLAIGNLLYGVDADLDRSDRNRAEHVRRLSEVANILLDAGLILIATAIALTQDELDLIRTAVGSDRVSAVWVGEQLPTAPVCELTLGSHEVQEEGVARLKVMLQDKGVIYRPW